MGWLRIDLSGRHVAVPHDCGDARARRIALRQRLRSEPGLTGAAALELATELRVLELREAAESLQNLHQS